LPRYSKRSRDEPAVRPKWRNQRARRDKFSESSERQRCEVLAKASDKVLSPGTCDEACVLQSIWESLRRITEFVRESHHFAGQLGEDQDEIEMVLKWDRSQEVSLVPDTVHFTWRTVTFIRPVKQIRPPPNFLRYGRATYEYQKEEMRLPERQSGEAGFFQNGTFIGGNGD